MKENSAAVHAQVPVDVATFLLNEKRADIHSIEARLKVNVILIPNIHLETPNYQVERRRHDDLNQEGALPASYELVSVPTEKEAEVSSASDAKPQRIQAAVQNFTPGQPAPMPSAPMPAAPSATASNAPAEPGRAGIIGRIVGWFKRDAQPAPQTETPVPRPKPRDGPREGRRDRPERAGGRDSRGRRDSQEGRPPREGQRNEPRQGDRPPRAERGPRNEARGDRPERGPRPDRPPREGRRDNLSGQSAGAPSSMATMAPPAEGASDAQRPDGVVANQAEGERRRRRRGGRDRNREGREPRESNRPQLASDGNPAGSGSTTSVATDSQNATVVASSNPEPFRSPSSAGLPDTPQPPQSEISFDAPKDQTAAATSLPPTTPDAAMPAVREPAPVTAPAAVPESVPAAIAIQKVDAPHSPVREEAQSAPAARAPVPATETAPLESILQSSGLVLVQTRPDVKIELPPEPEFRPAKRERRAPPPETPMVQVNTRPDQNPPT